MSLRDWLIRRVPAVALLCAAVLHIGAAAPVSTGQTRLPLSEPVTLAPGIRYYTLDASSPSTGASPTTASA